jgi:predicted small metal-binding protein
VKKLTVSEVITMGLKLACRDVGVDCSYVARGETMDQLMAAGGKHAKEVHGYTDQQLNNPELIAKIKAAVKQE